MTTVGLGLAKAETFLIVIAAFCLIGAAAVFVVHYNGMIPTAAISEITANEQDEPARVPLPAGPRRFQ